MSYFTKWWKKTYHRIPSHGPCCTCQTCGQFYENDCRCDCEDVAVVVWQAAIELIEDYLMDACDEGPHQDCECVYCELAEEIAEKFRSM